MSASPSKLSLVFVHGSWFGPDCWAELTKILERHGYACSAVALPSTQLTDLPPADLTDDTEAVNAEVKLRLNTSNVIVVAHSYGGTPANNALKGLDQKSRIAEGEKTFVERLLFLCAIPSLPGTNFLAQLGGKPGPIHDLRVPEFAWVGAPGPHYWFLNEHSPTEIKYWSSTLRPQSWKAYLEETTHAAYLEIPSHYLICTKDQAVLPVWQEGIVARAKEIGALFAGMEAIDADHCPFIGKTAEGTAEFIRRAAGER